MRLHDLLTTICASDSESWLSFEPPYEIDVTYLATDGAAISAEIFCYEAKWIFREDVTISVGISQEIEDFGREFNAEWNTFPDKRVKEHFLDVFLNGHVVFREKVLSVDGGRSFLPCPKTETVDTGQMWREPFSYSVTKLQADLAHFLADVRADREYEGYFKQSGFVVLPEI